MVIMYGDKITGSMKEAIDETNRRRAVQEAYNVANNITPKTVLKSAHQIMNQTKVADSKIGHKAYALDEEEASIAADPVVAYMTKPELEKLATSTQKNMEKAAKELDFITAARLRDELFQLKDLLKQRH
jgi:excinuclease ABC subunit B